MKLTSPPNELLNLGTFLLLPAITTCQAQPHSEEFFWKVLTNKAGVAKIKVPITY